MTDSSAAKTTGNRESGESDDARHQVQSETPTAPRAPADPVTRDNTPGRKPLFRS